MAHREMLEPPQTGQKRASRRNSIKGVIAAGASVSAAGCLFRGPGTLFAQQASAPGSVENPTHAELAQAISGNLCRYQDYDKILTAATRAAESSRRG